ncbi:MAG: DUF928 domain-containing protein [Prochloraceae cyanobacterium]
MNKKTLLVPTSILLMLGITTFNSSILDNKTRVIAGDSNKSIFKRTIPKDRSTTTSTGRGAGSRGTECNNLEDLNLTLFSPYETAATTISSHPTFLLYLNKIPVLPLQFSLVDIETAKTLVFKKIEIDRTGVVALRLPEATPELEIGKKYAFTIGVMCTANDPALDYFRQVTLSRVKTPTELYEAKSDRERFNILESKNIWYDALIEAHKLQKQSGDLTALKQILERQGFKESYLFTEQISFVNWDNSTDIKYRELN